MRRVILCCIFLVILAGSCTFSFPIDEKKNVHEPNLQRSLADIPDHSHLNESDPISILRNYDFVLGNHTGNGTEESPYIIENLYFNLNKSYDMPYGLKALEIKHTEAHFVVRDCLFVGEAYWSVDPQSGLCFNMHGIGIELLFVRNAQFYNNTFVYTLHGIQGKSIINSTISNNTFLGNPQGTPMEYGARGIYIDEADDFAKDFLSENLNITHNTFQHCSAGMRLEETLNSLIYNNTANWCDSAIVSHIDSQLNSILNNTCLYNSFGGICLHSSDNTTVKYNNCTANGYYGINVDESSDNNNITLNYCSLNGQPGTFTAPSLKLASLDTGHGVRVVEGSTNNKVTWNELVDNEQNVINNVAGNKYDYNYYSDYSGYDLNGDNIGDTPYDIPGSSPTQDIHPRGPFDSEEDTVTEPITFSPIIVAGVSIGTIAVVVLLVWKKR